MYNLNIKMEKKTIPNYIAHSSVLDYLRTASKVFLVIIHINKIPHASIEMT